MKSLRSFLLYGSLMACLTACPFQEPPAPLAPLPQPKTDKMSYNVKTQICQLREGFLGSYQYDGAGRVTAILPLCTKIVYDDNGYIREAIYDLGGGITGKMTFEYDQQSLIKSVKRETDGVSFYRVYNYANGVFTGQDLVSANGPPTKTSTANPLGLVVSTNTGGVYEYDENGNLIIEKSSGSTTTYQYDKQSNPDILVQSFLKGQGSVFNPSLQMLLSGSPVPSADYSRNNRIKSMVSYDDTTRKSVVTNYEIVYNSRNLPVSRKVENSEQLSTLAYENCN